MGATSPSSSSLFIVIALVVIGVCIVFIAIALVVLFAKMRRTNGKAQIYLIEPQE